MQRSMALSSLLTYAVDTSSRLISLIRETVPDNSKPEIGNAKRAFGGGGISVKDVKEAIGEILEAGSEREAFGGDWIFGEEASLEEVREAFGVFDENRDGFIDAEEVKSVLRGLGVMEASESECHGMIRAFDSDGDGKISFREFTQIVEESFR